MVCLSRGLTLSSGQILRNSRTSKSYGPINQFKNIQAESIGEDDILGVQQLMVRSLLRHTRT